MGVGLSGEVSRLCEGWFHIEDSPVGEIHQWTTQGSSDLGFTLKSWKTL